MSLPIPLSVTLETSRRTMRITSQVRDLHFRSVVPGGFASCSIGLDRPLSYEPDEIAYYGKLSVHDARTGRTVWEGRLEDPGRSAGSDGQIWDLAAIGPSGHARDRTVPVVYVSTNMGDFSRSNYSAKTVDVSTEDDDALDPDGLVWVVKQEVGADSPTGTAAVVVSRICYDAGQDLARLTCTMVNGNGTTNIENRLRTRPSPNGTRTAVASNAWSTGTQTLTASRGGANPIAAGEQIAEFGWLRVGAGSTASDNTWSSYWNVIQRGLLQDASGNDITSGYSTDTVLASQVVNDLLGRLLSEYDGPNATVATTSYGIEQLAYPDGTTAADILEDLMVLEPAYYWAAWERGDTGLHRFEWAAWPTAIRYEADVTDGYRSTGSADGLYNAVRVRFLDKRGRPRSRFRSATVPVLDDAGLTREAFLDLADNAGSGDNAEQAGDEFLADHAVPPNAGQLTVARPILDRIAGRLVSPWEIRPGSLIRVRGVLPSVDSLNATARDGVTVFRVVATDFRAADAAATLELDSYAPSTARALATLQTKLERARQSQLRTR